MQAKKISLNPLAKTFVPHKASEVVGFGCHAVNNSLPHSTGDTEVCVLFFLIYGPPPCVATLI